MGEKRVLVVGQIRPGRSQIPVRRLSMTAVSTKGKPWTLRATIPRDILQDLETEHRLDLMAEQLTGLKPRTSSSSPAAGASPDSAPDAGQSSA